MIATEKGGIVRAHVSENIMRHGMVGAQLYQAAALATWLAEVLLYSFE